MRLSDRRLMFTLGLIGLAGLAWLALAAGLLWLVLPAPARASLMLALDGRQNLLILLWLLTLLPVSVVLRWALDRHVQAWDRLAEQSRAVISQDLGIDTRIWPTETQRQLSDTLNQLVDQRCRSNAERNQQLTELTRESERKHARLSALMAGLDKSVVVCNLEGQVLLYNPRARLQFKRLSKAPGITQGAELIGLGRSIFTVIERELVDHALDKIRRRLQRGAAHPSSQFVTAAAGGKLFRGLVSPVTEVDALDADEHDRLTGFVLMLENITEDIDAHQRKDALLSALSREARSTLAACRALLAQAAEPADGDGVPGAKTTPTRAVADGLHAQLDRLDAQLDQAGQIVQGSSHSSWPLEDMLAEEWLEASVDRLHQRLHSQLPQPLALQLPAQPIWLRLDSHALMQILISLVERLAEQTDAVPRVLALENRPGQALIDLHFDWPADQDLPTLDDWLNDWLDRPLALAAGSPCPPREILRRHLGELWIDRTGATQASARLLLPSVQARDELPLPATGERPQFFDFDLFRRPTSARLADRALAQLQFTVFDLETTGLNPSAGDEIIQIGAVRVVNGRVLDDECFDQLVDPNRSIPELGRQIHGIHPDQVRGQPRIETVLPAFHAYARDSVLVAHNAAFDMRCLTLKQSALGLRFDQPVLDTLILATLAQPNQPSHSLDALAERFGLVIRDRHSGLGDARATAGILVCLIPLLADRGIVTLAQAMQACQRSDLARLAY